MSIVHIIQLQLGSQLAICLYNKSNKLIRGLCPKYNNTIGDVPICTNIAYRGSHRIEAGQFNIIILELPNVDKLISGTISFDGGRLKFQFQPTITNDNIDLLKKIFVNSLKKHIDVEQELSQAIKVFQKL